MLSTLLTYAEETIIVGDVYSAETGAAVPNASIYYQATKYGTTSNEEGSFALRADLTHRQTLIVSAVGYRTERFAIQPGMMAGLQVELHEQNAMLSELIVTPGANPALAMLQKVRERRGENDRARIGISAPHKRSTELYLSGINRRHLTKRLWGSLQSGMILAEDSTYLLPLYSSERGALVMTETDYQSLITNDGDLNFYDNEISLMGRSFLSPLARSGNTYYQYYLSDSIDAAHSEGTIGKTYIIHFRTKNPFYETLNGSLYIDSATYAITAIEAEVPQQTSVNYLRGAHIHQHYAPDHSLANEQIQLVLDFAVKIDQSRTFPTVLIRHSLESEDRPVAPHINGSNHIIREEDTTIDAAMDSLANAPVVRVARWAAEVITTGYIPTGTPVDFGHIQEILQVNRTEGVHVGLPLRTNERLMRHVSLEAAVGYGFRNRQVTGLGRVSAILPAARRHLLVAEYHDRQVWPEVSELSRLCYENGIGYHTMDFTAYALEAVYNNRNAANTLRRQREFSLRTENDWTDHLETQLYLKIGNMGFSYQTLGGIIRLGWGERKVDRYMQRYHVRSHLPVLYLQAEGGSWSMADETNRLYARLGLMLRQEVNLSIAGTLDYSFTAGATFGRVPELLLHHFEGNQTYAYDPYRFTLMNNGQYNARYYLQTHLAWNGRGVLFNLIPGIRYLRLRELLTFKLAYGVNPNIGNAPESTTAVALTTPYIELGCGIGNIFRVLDLHSVWRLTHRDDPMAPRWAMRFRINVDL